MLTFPIRGDSFEIRPITPGEMDALLEVYRQCEDFLALGPQPHASLAMVQADLELSRQEGGIFCGIYAREGSRIIGVVDFVPYGFEGQAGDAFLSLLMIAAPYRKHGLGAEVVDLVEKTIWQDTRVSRIRSGVQVNNPQAIHFWQKVGYEVISAAQLLSDGTTAFQLLKKRPRP